MDDSDGKRAAPRPSWFVIAHAWTVAEAQTVRLNLAQAGIPAEVWDTHLNALHPWLTHALGGVRVVVPRDCAEEARRILASGPEAPVSDEELTRQALAATAPPESRRRPPPIFTSDIVLAIWLAVVAAVFLYGLLRLV